ncbi:MAG TPA: RraA family protein [Chitinophagaceae bacterium]|nr:RraA family protein [Chitinophagaceae bacterium]
MRKLLSWCLLLFGLAVCGPVAAQKKLTDEEILRLFKGLRVADVSDGMDMAGLKDVGLMNQRIQALWKDIDKLSHQFTGIAVTARYVPTNRHVPNNLSNEEFTKWEGMWYSTISPETYVDSIRPGKVVVIDNQGDGDVGSVGSFNSLAWVQKGAVGIVSEGGIRDTDEIIKQGIPVYLDPLQRGRGIRPGRNELESVNKPVVIGGVLVNAGDIIVADGDGVVVVPRAYAERVARAARVVLDTDKNARLNLYKSMGRPLDQTVTPSK